MFSLKRKGDFRLQLTRTLKEPGRHKVELYLFTPHETTLSPWTLAEKQFYFSSLTHSFGLLGLPAKDRASKDDGSFSLLSPHYEIMYGSWFFQYRRRWAGCASSCRRARTLPSRLPAPCA